MRWVVVLGVVLSVAAAGNTAAAAPNRTLADGAPVTAIGSVNPARVVQGGMVALNATFTSPARLDAVNLSLEVHDPGGALIFKRLFEGEMLDAGQSRSYAVRWSAPTPSATGNYSLRLGAFSTDYSVSYAWNDSAASFAIVDGFSGLTPTTYYIDCNGGADSNDGLQAGRAWATLARLNAAILEAGDTVKLNRGCTWTGSIEAVWNGAPDHPITFTAYGAGDAPTIQNGDFAEIRVTGSYSVFDNLDIRADPLSLDTACNNNPIGRRVGIYIDRGATHNVVQNSVVEDNSAGIVLGLGSSNNIVQHNEIRNNNMMDSIDPYEDDGGGNGVLLQGDSNDISYNHITGSLACSTRYTHDGSAFEVFGGSDNRIHHNHIDGNWIFVELAQGNNNEFAYNVSTDPGVTNHWDALGTKLYNNVFYVPGGAGVVGCIPCGPGSMSIVNNIFVAASAIYADGGVTEDHNIYWNPTGSPYLSMPMSRTSRIANPLFVDPANGRFDLQPNSPAAGTGSTESLDHGYTVDANGAAVTPVGPVDIGAFQISGPAAGAGGPGSR